jgi:hypothetical protein
MKIQILQNALHSHLNLLKLIGANFGGDPSLFSSYLKKYLI